MHGEGGKARDLELRAQARGSCEVQGESGCAEDVVPAGRVARDELGCREASRAVVHEELLAAEDCVEPAITVQIDTGAKLMDYPFGIKPLHFLIVYKFFLI